MIECEYKGKSGCALIAAITGKCRLLPDSTCKDRCGPNDIVAQTKMARQYFGLPTPPDGKDLLEWAKECVENGTVKLTPQAERVREQKVDQAKAMAELPSWFQQLGWARKHAIEIAAYKLKTGRILVSPEWKAARLDACDDCEKLWVNPKTQNKKCSTCGCNVVGLVGDNYGKADFEALTCDQWNPVDAKYNKPTIPGG
jgi:hypothetical protein